MGYAEAAVISAVQVLNNMSSSDGESSNKKTKHNKNHGWE